MAYLQDPLIVDSKINQIPSFPSECINEFKENRDRLKNIVTMAFNHLNATHQLDLDKPESSAVTHYKSLDAQLSRVKNCLDFFAGTRKELSQSERQEAIKILEKKIKSDKIGKESVSLVIDAWHDQLDAFPGQPVSNIHISGDEQIIDWLHGMDKSSPEMLEVGRKDIHAKIDQRISFLETGLQVLKATAGSGALAFARVPQGSHQDEMIESSKVYEKYKDIFVKYQPVQGKTLIIKDNGVDSRLKPETLLKVIAQADKLLTDKNDQVVRTKGRLITEDEDEFIVKVDAEGQEKEKLHVIRHTKFEKIGLGGTGVVRNVLLVSEGCFKPFKTARHVEDDTNVYEMDQVEGWRSDDTIKKHQAALKNEFSTLTEINSKQHPNLQHRAITWIDIERPGKQAITGFLSPERYQADLIDWTADHPNDSNEVRVKRCMEMMRGVNEIWQQGFRNTDIKLDNMFIDKDGVLRVGDFDAIYRQDESDPVRKFEFGRWTKGYMTAYDYAELYRTAEEGNQQGFLAAVKKQAVFAAGVSMFAILTGAPPYFVGLPPKYKMGKFIVQQKVCDKELKARKYPEEVEALILKMIKCEPKDRIDFHLAAVQWEKIAKKFQNLSSLTSDRKGLLIDNSVAKKRNAITS